MPTQTVNGVRLYYEVTGDGFPMVFNHEFGGDYRSWEEQVRCFARRYKVITYNVRGFPPSEVPTDAESYSESIQVEDLYELLRSLGVRKAHVLGLSMGGNLTLNFGFAHPDMCASLVVAGCGAGSKNRAEYERVTLAAAELVETKGIEGILEPYTTGPTRVQLRRKNPRGWQEFRGQLASHSARGAAMTLRGVQLRRPSILSLETKLALLSVPTLLMVGDEDEACIEPALFMKRHISRAGLVVLPQSGHPINLEEPDRFNYLVADFLTAVEADKWAERGPIALPGTELMSSKD